MLLINYNRSKQCMSCVGDKVSCPSTISQQITALLCPCAMGRLHGPEWSHSTHL